MTGGARGSLTPIPVERMPGRVTAGAEAQAACSCLGAQRPRRR